ncbi:MAG: hypothetical protein V3U54_12585 [Thermodesulfobacteriota bacterium]
MRLHNLVLVDIQGEADNFTYIYAVLAKSFFKKKFLKYTFNSKLPHYWWTEIQKNMMNKKIFFEDLTENQPTDLGIGTLTYTTFSKEDLNKYGEDVQNWKALRDVAVDNQLKLSREYNDKYGIPDLSNN